MRKIVLLGLICLPVFAYANSCEIAKSKINISGLALGKSILSLKAEHPKNLSIDHETNKANINYVHSNEFEDAFSGTPATNAGFISFDGNTKLINAFSVSFGHLDNFSANNYKNGLVALYSLPKTGWIESKSNGVKVFKYECTDYSLEINYNPERSSFMIFKEI